MPLRFYSFIDVVLNASPNTLETEQVGRIGFEALNAKLIAAI